MCPSDQHAVEAQAFAPAEFAVVQVSVVDDLRNRAHLRITNGKFFAKRFKRAVVATVPKASALEHIERDGLGYSFRVGCKGECCRWIDKFSDQPGGRHPVYARTWTGHPRALTKVFRFAGC